MAHATMLVVAKVVNGRVVALAGRAIEGGVVVGRFFALDPVVAAEMAAERARDAAAITVEAVAA